MRRMLATLALGLFVTACGDTYVLPATAPAPAPAPVVVVPTRIQFRVTGNATSVRVRFSDPVNGLTQTITGLPYFVETSTTLTTLFLSLDVTPLTFPTFTLGTFMDASIFVDGNLFREASSTDSQTVLSASGSWRK